MTADEAVERAIEDVAGAISKKVETGMATALGLTPDELKTLAEAVAALKWGEQGATDYRYMADYHATQHEGEHRQRPAGFGSYSLNAVSAE